MLPLDVFPKKGSFWKKTPLLDVKPAFAGKRSTNSLTKPVFTNFQAAICSVSKQPFARQMRSSLMDDDHGSDVHHVEQSLGGIV